MWDRKFFLRGERMMGPSLDCMGAGDVLCVLLECSHPLVPKLLQMGSCMGNLLTCGRRGA
jgi:hypothetical protein